MDVFLPFCRIRAFIGQNDQKRNTDYIRLINGHLAWENDKHVGKAQNSGHIHFLGVWGRGKKKVHNFCDYLRDAASDSKTFLGPN